MYLQKCALTSKCKNCIENLQIIVLFNNISYTLLYKKCVVCTNVYCNNKIFLSLRPWCVTIYRFLRLSFRGYLLDDWMYIYIYSITIKCQILSSSTFDSLGLHSCTVFCVGHPQCQTCSHMPTGNTDIAFRLPTNKVAKQCENNMCSCTKTKK